MPRVLEALAFLQAGLGLAVIGVVIRFWWRAGRPGLLRHCPIRAHRLTLAWVLACSLAYFVTALATRGALEAFSAGPAPAGGSQPTEAPAHRSATELSVINAAAQLSGLAACLLVAGFSFRRGLGGLGLTLDGWRRGLAWGVLGWTAFEPVSQLLLWLSTLAIGVAAPGYRLPEHPTVEYLRDPRIPWFAPALLYLGAAVLAPVAEEVFFRGLVQTYLRRVLRSRRYAVATTAAIFGVIHGGQPQAVLPLIAFALLLGVCYERTGSLVAPVLMHSLFNSQSLLWQALAG